MTFKFILSLDWFLFFVPFSQCSFHFPEGKEPYEWIMEKMHAYSRSYKCELKALHIDGRGHNEAISKRPEHIPLETWAKLVEFLGSNKGRMIFYC